MRLQTALLLLLTVSCRPNGPAPPSDAPLGPSNPPEDQWVQIGDVSLHYLDWGGTGGLLLLIPGVTGTAHIYNDIASDFTDSFRVVAMTRRGHGASDKPADPFDLDALADDIAGVIDHFTDQPAVLVGHSYGGIELPRVASQHASKVEALIFLDAVYDWAGLMEMPMQPGYDIPDSTYSSYEELAAWYRASLPEFWSPGAQAHLRSQVRELEDGGVAWQLPFPSPDFMRFAALYPDWSGEEFDGIEVPVLSIQADQGAFLEPHLIGRGFSAEEASRAAEWARDYDNVSKAAGRAMLEAAVPHTVTTLIDSTHHILQLQRPREVVQEMKRFLSGQAGG
jgi:pimeloyl-ACP methyl ester carboxylesterase